MKKKNQKYIYIIAVLVVLAVVGLVGSANSDNAISAHFYDKNGHEVKLNPLGSIVSSGSQSIQGVYSMNFVVTVKNTGDIALTASIGSASPIQLKNALPNSLLTVAPGETKSWTSSLIDTTQFDGTSPTFSVIITGSYDYAGQTKTISKQGSLSYGFAADPTAGLDISLGSSVGDSGLGTTTTNLFTAGTVCTANSQCQSNSCVRQTYTASCGGVQGGNAMVYGCSSDNNCYQCSENSNFQCQVTGSCTPGQPHSYGCGAGYSTTCTAFNSICS